MSSALRLFALGIVIAAAATRADAQDLQTLARKADAAAALRDSAVNRSVVVHSEATAARNAIYTDTVFLAGRSVEVLASRDIAALVRAGADSAELFLRDRLGDRMSSVPMSVYTARTDTIGRAAWQVRLSRLRSGREGQAHYLNRDAGEIARAIEANVQQSLIDLREPIALWLMTPIPLDTTADEAWRSVRLHLATSPTTIAPRCYRGDIVACKAFLGLTVEADPALAWYDSAARRSIVQSTAKTGALDAAASARCVAGNDIDCGALMRSSVALTQWVDAPAYPLDRAALLDVAFRAGGQGSLGELLAHDTLPVGLAAASKIPVDSVVARWQRHVHDAAVRSEAFTPGIALLSVGWILALGGLSTRSSRWR
jgi:hypothetical protein